ncbi:hypothetical protein MASR2M17_21080 [Aminivibrio sp.]
MPEAFDVMVMPNVYGDLVSDLTAGLVGGLGVGPGVNYGDNIAVFESVHGSVLKICRLDRINPTAMILSACLMLRHLDYNEGADRIECSCHNNKKARL